MGALKQQKEVLSGLFYTDNDLLCRKRWKKHEQSLELCVWATRPVKTSIKSWSSLGSDLIISVNESPNDGLIALWFTQNRFFFLTHCGCDKVAANPLILLTKSVTTAVTQWTITRLISCSFKLQIIEIKYKNAVLIIWGHSVVMGLTHSLKMTQ